MSKNSKSWLSSRPRGIAALTAGLAITVIAGLAVSLAAAQDGNGSRESEPTSKDGTPPEPPAEVQEAMEEFRACMTEEGFEPPEPGERPEGSEDGPPEGLSDALEECGDVLPEDGPPGVGPGHGPGGPGCHGMPPGADKDSGKGGEESRSGDDE